MISLMVWGASTFDPFVHSITRESKLLSVFRFLIGGATHFVPWLKNGADHLSIYAMAMAGGAAFLYAWKRRLPPVSGAFLGLLITLAFYKVGHLQFSSSSRSWRDTGI